MSSTANPHPDVSLDVVVDDDGALRVPAEELARHGVHAGSRLRVVTGSPQQRARRSVRGTLADAVRSLPSAGVHLTIDLWGADGLDDRRLIEGALVNAARAARATLLKLFVHEFEPFGITGVALLAESHISVHTWPEHGYAAFDIFTCGDADPYGVIPVLESAFQPDRLHINEHKRCIQTQGHRP